MKVDFILADFRKRVVAPEWWEGHVIRYKEYLVKGGIGLLNHNLASRDGDKQKLSPYQIGQPVTVKIGGKPLCGEVYCIAIHRPGWDTDDPNGIDIPTCEWIVTVCFPRIPKKHLKYL